MRLFKDRLGECFGDRMWVSVSEALAFCNKNKYKITKQGLIYIGKKERWIVTEGKYLIVFVKDLVHHIKNSRDKVPWGWVTVASMRKLTEKGNVYYNTINNSEIEIRIYGREKKRYARKEDIKRIFRKNKQSDTKSKKEK